LIYLVTRNRKSNHLYIQVKVVVMKTFSILQSQILFTHIA